MTYPEFPLECIVRTDDDGLRARLVRAAVRQEADAVDDVMCLVAEDGLRVLGRDEADLRRAVDRLVDSVGETPGIEGPLVRYVNGARRLEPHMRLMVHAPTPALAVLRDDLERRGARMLRLEYHIGRVALEAEAPLACLLGYADWLAACTDGVGRSRMWLSRYRLTGQRTCVERDDEEALPPLAGATA
jgi:translation elongation factor EF-G